ncbi:MAG: C4-type zinc ribbon domain-containing protein [Opitutales bacterium]|jgi:predicted  nucleic acid-binding Zn-ribbon protein|tara:strand:- start:129 stop:776 length:648 start_codon:yes stop_codon:yes gene_type:complete
MEKELGNIPNLIVKMESRIKLEQDTIEAATQDLRSLETRNTTLEKEIDSITDQITRLKNKQLEVKKNEEYQALENEIRNLLHLQSEKEDLQIEILVKIDGAKETAEIAKTKIAQRVESLELEKQELIQRKDELGIEIQKLSSELEDSRSEVEEILIKGYDRTKKMVSRPPYIAPLEDQKCSGCNLRVSNEVVSSVLVERKLTHCDQCGRIVYCER